MFIKRVNFLTQFNRATFSMKFKPVVTSQNANSSKPFKYSNRNDEIGNFNYWKKEEEINNPFFKQEQLILEKKFEIKMEKLLNDVCDFDDKTKFLRIEKTKN